MSFPHFDMVSFLNLNYRPHKFKGGKLYMNGEKEYICKYCESIIRIGNSKTILNLISDNECIIKQIL